MNEWMNEKMNEWISELMIINQIIHVYAEMNGTMLTVQNNLTNKSRRRKKSRF